MAKTDLNALASPLLADGEDVIAAVRVNWNGMVPPSRVTTGIPPRGAAADAPQEPDAETLVAFPSAKQMAIVLTGGRMLAWSLGISGKPKQFLGDVPLTAVSAVEAASARFGSLIRISLKSGAVIDLEAMRGEPAATFGAQLQHLTADP